MKLIEGMSEQMGEELRGELVKHKEVAKRQQTGATGKPAGENQAARRHNYGDERRCTAGVCSYDGEDRGEEEGEGLSLRWGKRRSGNRCGRAGRRGGS